MPLSDDAGSIRQGRSFADQAFDIDEADRLLMTTRAVRKRLDFDRDVPDQVIFDCINAAEQAPSGGNDASRRWIVVRDPELKEQLGEIYRRSGQFMNRVADRLDGTGHEKEQVFSSSAYLVENFAKAPVLVIAAIWGLHDNSGRPGLFDSVVPSAWSFNLALRARGLGSTWTTMLNANVDELAEILGIPDGVTTIVTFPVAYTEGTSFRAVPRRPAEEITYFDQWGFTRSAASSDGSTRVADGQGVVVEVDIDAKRRDVWPHVADIAAPAAFSREFQGAEWTSDERGVGATFVGRNKLGDREWEVECHVTDHEEPACFAWATTDPENPGATWRFDLSEIGIRTRLRFSMEIGQTNNGTVTRALADGADEAAVLNGRRSMLKDNMAATVEGIKALAEAGRDDGSAT